MHLNHEDFYEFLPYSTFDDIQTFIKPLYIGIYRTLRSSEVYFRYYYNRWTFFEVGNKDYEVDSQKEEILFYNFIF